MNKKVKVPFDSKKERFSKLVKECIYFELEFMDDKLNKNINYMNKIFEINAKP